MDELPVPCMSLAHEFSNNLNFHENCRLIQNATPTWQEMGEVEIKDCTILSSELFKVVDLVFLTSVM